MYPPIQEICRNDESLKKLLGGDDIRIYPFGEAPQEIEVPYVVHQLVSGSPFNTLTTPCADLFSLQIDVYGSNPRQARVVAYAVRKAIQGPAYVTGYNLDERDTDTRLWRYSFDTDWRINRRYQSIYRS
ncbi:hypothetical protein R84981_000981 [Carnimonas sp. R-84981]|uniref:tail completion protein gp17 n=1 Tax=Carnimonas bestiolae TaxID=3402172 RepID=UPI003EDC7909